MGLKAKWEYFRAIYERYGQADRPTAAREKGTAQEADVRAHQARPAAETPHSGEDRQLGCGSARIHGDRSGFAFRQLGGWRIWAHPERDGYSHQLDRIASGAGERANRSASGAESSAERAAVPPAGGGFGQRVGIHQLAFESLVRASGDPTHSGAALQERRQRPRGTEKLDPRAQAAGLGPL